MLVSKVSLIDWLNETWEIIGITTPTIHKECQEFMWSKIILKREPIDRLQGYTIYEYNHGFEFLFHQFLEHLAEKARN